MPNLQPEQGHTSSEDPNPNPQPSTEETGSCFNPTRGRVLLRAKGTNARRNRGRQPARLAHQNQIKEQKYRGFRRQSTGTRAAATAEDRDHSPKLPPTAIAPARGTLPVPADQINTKAAGSRVPPPLQPRPDARTDARPTGAREHPPRERSAEPARPVKSGLRGRDRMAQHPPGTDGQIGRRGRGGGGSWERGRGR